MRVTRSGLLWTDMICADRFTHIDPCTLRIGLYRCTLHFPRTSLPLKQFAAESRPRGVTAEEVQVQIGADSGRLMR